MRLRVPLRPLPVINGLRHHALTWGGSNLQPRRQESRWDPIPAGFFLRRPIRKTIAPSLREKMKKDFQAPLEIRRQIGKELGRASLDRHHAWRTPVLATAGQDGAVNARTVLLRGMDVVSQTLQIDTDRRSSKVCELVKEPNAMFVFWSARLHWQLRVRVRVRVRLRVLVSIANQNSGSEVEAHWQRVQQTAAATDYFGPLAPGSPRPEAHNPCTLPFHTNHFALLIAQVLEIDWLELGREGHRRARLSEDRWQWLMPRGHLSNRANWIC